MTSKSFMRRVMFATIIVPACWSLSACGKQPGATAGIPPETGADYLHAVGEADRTFYTIQVVERLQKRGTMGASEEWRVSHTLPVPAPFLMESSELAANAAT